MFRGTFYGVEHADALVAYVLQIDCANTSDHLGYDYGSYNSQTISHHPAVRDDGKNYTAFPHKAVPEVVPLYAVANYYLKAKGFSIGCIAHENVPLALSAIPSGVENLVEHGPFPARHNDTHPSVQGVTKPFFRAAVVPMFNLLALISVPPSGAPDTLSARVPTVTESKPALGTSYTGMGSRGSISARYWVNEPPIIPALRNQMGHATGV